MNNEEYLKQEYSRARTNLFNSKRKGFGSKDELANWFITKLKSQKYCCYYCETSIFDINKLIDTNALKTRAVRGGGRRGPVLEIDKNDTRYIPENCVLSCYYCNNDKSYTTSKEDYKEFFGKNRNNYFKTLLSKLNNSNSPA